MFTGLIQQIGTVTNVTAVDQSAELTISTTLGSTLRDGDSLAVNGVCLTVYHVCPNSVCATAVAETLNCSTLSLLKIGSRVNLEPALRMGDALGGHWVQGHVDGTAMLQRRTLAGNAQRLSFSLEDKWCRYIVHKGSITVDGVSLTVANLQADCFEVAVIPHTLRQTTLASIIEGDYVNIEIDILAKYVARLSDEYVKTYTDRRIGD